MEFSKKITIFLMFFGVACVTASFVLAFMGKDTNNNVTIAAITQLIVTQSGYMTYQYGLKHSRNKHGVNEDGKRFEETEKTTIEDEYRVFGD